MLLILLIWGLGWVLSIAIVAWRTGDVPGALLAAGPSGLLGIVVAFQTGNTNGAPNAPPPATTPDPRLMEEK